MHVKMSRGRNVVTRVVGLKSLHVDRLVFVPGETFKPDLYRFTHASIRDNDLCSDCYGELLSFPYLHTLDCQAEIPIAAIEQLARCDNLKHLRLNFRKNANQPLTAPLTPTMGVDALHLLERLRLKSIELYGGQIDDRHIEQVARPPQPETHPIAGCLHKRRSNRVGSAEASRRENRRSTGLG